ncbi:HtrA protease [Rhodovulum sp. PH10]|uniref:DegQ family serine endoprotease n=1 Tax=Rhodovulum sp. PH10 TaxID=1187851 RepID=UPI00027C2949|nr:DegQ family serine endoprotease [Rhodovulum sp. PH10]EJW11213.1 HtrA protease [Rhodovulum sp. PH10]
MAAAQSFDRSRRTRRLPAAALLAAVLLAGVAGAPTPVLARGPEAIADVTEQVMDAVVNISTSQTVEAHGNAVPNLPPGSPFEEFFEEFFKKRRGQDGETGPRERAPRRVNSLGSGFVIDPSGIVVTNNHVISDADEVNVILNDGTRLKAEILGRDKEIDLAVLKVKSDKPLKAVAFGDSDRLRIGEWVIAIGNPFSLGGTVTAGIVSARNRDINSGRYDNYIQTDAAINRGNSGGPLFNLDGQVVGINTAIISPSGGSIGIGFAVPSKTAMPVIDQLRKYGETRRGWLGVRIQQVTDDIAESLGMKAARGALVAGVDEKGPAKPAGIESGDVIVSFDGKDIKEMRDLPRIVAETPVGKDVEVTVLRNGKEERKTVKLGRLEDGEKQAALEKGKDGDKLEQKSVVQSTLGLDLADLNDTLRQRYKIKDSVKGVVITSVDAGSAAAEKRLNAGDVIVEVSQEAVATAADVKKRIDQLEKDGRRSALLLIANADGDLRFVALSLK